MNKMITQAAYARQRGVSPARISHLITKGVIVLIGGKVNPEQADAAIEKAANPAYTKTLGRPAKDRGPNNYAEAAMREKHFKALLAELDLKEREASLVNAEDLRRELAKLFTDVKSRLRAIPSKTAGEVYHMALSAQGEKEGKMAISKKLLAEIDEALGELSKWKPSAIPQK